MYILAIVVFFLKKMSLVSVRLKSHRVVFFRVMSTLLALTLHAMSRMSFIIEIHPQTGQGIAKSKILD